MTSADIASDAITADDTREFRRLRSLLISPGAVEVLHSTRGQRVWMTDRYSMIDVTGSPAIRPDMPDGEYRLMTSRGFVFRERGPNINMAVYLARMQGLTWYEAYATRWSVTESKAKAMIMFVCRPRGHSGIGAQAARRVPLAMNEDLWQSVRACYPEAVMSHTGDRGDPFRITAARGQVIGYIQPVQIPPQLEITAKTIADNSPRGHLDTWLREAGGRSKMQAGFIEGTATFDTAELAQKREFWKNELVRNGWHDKYRIVTRRLWDHSAHKDVPCYAVFVEPIPREPARKAGSA